MNTRILPLLFVLSSSLLAAPPPELTVLRQQYDKAYAERVTTVHEASIGSLDAKFTLALDNAVATAKAGGDLPTVLAIQSDKKLLATKQPLPADDDKTPEPLKKLRAIYREQLAKLEEQRTALVTALLTPYAARLKELEATLTKADRIDEAAEVLAYREGLKADAPIVLAAPSPSEPAPVKGGTLKGLGQFMFGNLPVDLSNAEGVSDFVEVKVSHMGWIARRANGEVRFQIQSYGDKTKGVTNTKKAVRVSATEAKPFFAIYEDGTAEMLGTRFNKDANPFPAEVSNVADVEVGNGIYFILHPDGNCSVQGKSQQEFITSLKLKEPGIIPGVAALTCSRYQAFFLMKDGSVTATTDFRNEPIAWVDLPREFRREIRTIAVGTSGNQLAAVTQQGDVLQAKGEKIDKKHRDIVDVRVGGDVAIVKNRQGEWRAAKPGDAEMDKLLVKALATPRIIDIDLHNFDNSGDGKLVSRAVLWIDPAP
jgi:hypothetical protein